MDKNLRTVTVTIGDHVGTDPLPRDAWRDFRTLTLAAVETRATAVHLVADGSGGWRDEATGAYVDERAYVITADVPADRVEGLRERLADLADYFDQDAVALTVGATDLVAPAARERVDH